MTRFNPNPPPPTVNSNVSFSVDAETRVWLSGIAAAFNSSLSKQLTQMEQRIMAKLDDQLAVIRADVADEKTLIGGLGTLIQGLKDQIANQVPGLTADQQAAVDEIFANAEANKKALTEALTANTQPAPPDTPPNP